MTPAINPQKTIEFVRSLKLLSAQGNSLAAATSIAERMGASVIGSSTRFLFWHPEIRSSSKVLLHLYLPDPNLIYDKPDQHCSTIYYQFEMERVASFATVVVDQLVAGDRDQFGAFYEFELLYSDRTGKIVRDPMAWSMPYGIHAPAEVYHIDKVLGTRKDLSYFKKFNTGPGSDEEIRIGASTNLLEIYIPTATKEGTLDALTHRYKQIANAIRENRSLQPEEQNLTGFDAVGLMPVAPVVEDERNHRFWKSVQEPEESGRELTVHLRKPDLFNWGYDSPLFGAAAINPALLSTGRPHELLDFIETLHRFPQRPKKVIIDLVYGHAHRQGEQLLPEEFFSGDNKYGRSVDLKNPMARAMVLEMHRRKMRWGFDGIRLDDVREFNYYDPEQDLSLADNDFLKELSEIGVEIKGQAYKPWIIFDDGRPWPGSDWEQAANHRDIMRQFRHSHQWAPAMFALNKPFGYTFWLSRWWRIKEHMRYGKSWISGYANHDSMRKGSQSDPRAVHVNFLLGNSLKMVMDTAYNNPSTTLLVNAFLPGVPMDFLQALGSSPWSFFRNTESENALNIVAREAFFADWQITNIEYRQTRFFRRLKNIGFETLPELRNFMRTLHGLARTAEWDIEQTLLWLNRVKGPVTIDKWDEQNIEQFVKAWMYDLFEYCNTDNHTELLNPKKTSFNLAVRNYRLENPWLNENFKKTDYLKYREPVDGTVIYYGYRKSEEAQKEIIFLANMEGQPRQVTPAQFDFPVNDLSEWEMVLSTPSVRVRKIDQPLRLSISQGVLFEKVNRM
ncbi:MAG TPA: glucosylglycerol hydrolase [Balneolaceae bacterium]|nr:glucosylglycerol hydrolase [Balneolaceae bacterium]